MRYVDGRELYKELVYSKYQGKMTHQLYQMCYLIVINLIPTICLKKPEDREDAINEAILIILENYWRYDEDISENAFSYITQTAKRAMWQFSSLIEQKHYSTKKSQLLFLDFSDVRNI